MYFLRAIERGIDKSTILDTFVLMTTQSAGPDLERAARVFHALSDPTRLRVVDLLRGGSAASAN